MQYDVNDGDYAKRCPHCSVMLQEQEKFHKVISQMRKVEQSFQGQIAHLKMAFDESQQKMQKAILSSNEAHLELKNISERLHLESMSNGFQSKNNIELKRKILTLESEVLAVKSQYQDTADELDSLKYLLNTKIHRQLYNHEHKFVDSLLQMVSSCQASSSQPSLKQAWKWLKTILSDYMQLKQVAKFKECSGQSSSSTNK